MTIDNLRMLDYLVQYKSLNKAAEKCFISQSSLTRQLNAVEHEIGVDLFKRTSYGVELTPAGKVFYNQTRNIIVQYDKAVKDSVNSLDGLQTICLGTNNYIQDIVANACEFVHDRHPNLSFSFAGNHVSDTSEQLYSGHADIVMMADISHPDDRLFQLHVCDINNSCIMYETHPLYDRTSLTIADLRDQTVLVPLGNGNSLNLPTMHKLLSEEKRGIKVQDYIAPGTAEIMCRVGNSIILSLGMMTCPPGFKNILLTDAPTVPIGIACLADHADKFRVIMNEFQACLSDICSRQ